MDYASFRSSPFDEDGHATDSPAAWNTAPAPQLEGARGGEETATRGLNSAAMQRVQTFLQHNLAERFTLSDLANAACMSRFHFARMFRLSFGVSPMEYVMRERVEYAKTLLARREQSVASIAATLGFCDQSHFTRSFRRITGWPPCRFVAHREKAQRRAG